MVETSVLVSVGVGDAVASPSKQFACSNWLDLGQIDCIWAALLWWDLVEFGQGWGEIWT